MINLPWHLSIPFSSSCRPNWFLTLFLEFSLSTVISGVNALFRTYLSHMTFAWPITSEVSCPVIMLFFCSSRINRKAQALTLSGLLTRSNFFYGCQRRQLTQNWLVQGHSASLSLSVFQPVLRSHT